MRGFDKAVGVKNRSAQEISAVVAALRDSSGRKMKPMKKPVLSRARSVQGRWTAALPCVRLAFLPGVAIAVMGCIVNGPGEMADADFGYVGGAPGKIDLYVGKEVVKRGIDNDTACDELIQLIKDHGRWVDKEEEEEAVAA